ncbi:PLP-dependent aminotransferase family protein, partial [Mesorhizobium sp.]
AVLDLAGELDIAVIEDAAYRALRYDGDGVPPILALDCIRSGGIDKARTLYCGSFSKILSPGMRVGWVCAPRHIVEKLVLMKQASDLHSPSINQVVMHRVAEAVFDGQVEKLIGAYRERRDGLLSALESNMPEGVTWSRPEGGMFVWVTLPEGADATELLARSVKEGRVAFVPGSAFYADGTGRNTLRLSFTLADRRAVSEGIPRLAAILKG